MNTQRNIHAWTEPTGEGFPGYVSVNANGPDQNSITVRGRGYSGRHQGSVTLTDTELLALADAIAARLRPSGQ